VKYLTASIKVLVEKANSRVASKELRRLDGVPWFIAALAAYHTESCPEPININFVSVSLK
jgi:hypothetical protein